MSLIIYVIIFNIYTRFVELLIPKYYIDSYFLTNFAPRIKCFYKHYLNILNKMRIKGNLFILVILCGFLFSANAQQTEVKEVKNYDLEGLFEKLKDLEEEVEDLKEEIEESKKICKKENVKEENKEKKNKKGEGKAILRGFVNFNLQSQGGETNVGFKLDRMYLGYEHAFNNGIKVKGIIDFGKPSDVDDYNYVAYIKNAFISWSKKGFTVSAGMIPATQSALQEKLWAKRYIMMVYLDQYKFSHSADLGLSLEYKFADWVKGDFTMVNGEGYKKIQMNTGLMYGLGFTFTPISDFYVRIYGGINNAGRTLKDKTFQENLYNYSSLVGYKGEKFSLVGEFNMVQNFNRVKDNNQLGCAVYGSAKLHKLIDVYARYDFLTSNYDSSNDKSAIIAGFDILPCKYVKISPNFRMDIPQHGGDNKYMAYINLMFDL